MTLDEIRHHIEIEAETFIKPQSKAVFRKTIEPYFQELSAFKKNLDVYVLELKKTIDKYSKSEIKSKFLDMYNSPGKDYINCSNTTPSIDAPYLDVYYPHAEYGHIWGWIPQKAYKNDPLKRLLSYASWGKPEGQDLTMFQFAIVAILHDAPNIENGCNLIYFGSGNDLADRAALEFMKVVGSDENRRIKTPFARAQGKRVINRLKNAFDTVKIKLGDNENNIAIRPAGKGKNNTLAKDEKANLKIEIGEIQAENVQIGDYALIHKEAKADVAEKPAGTEQDIAPAKRQRESWLWRLWTFVKRIPRWIYVLVIFLAALLTCLYHLGWL